MTASQVVGSVKNPQLEGNGYQGYLGRLTYWGILPQDTVEGKGFFVVCLCSDVT
jgi:hypothetical protein